MHFYAPGLKGPPGASSNRIVRPSVCLSVCLSVCPSVRNSVPLTIKVQYLKFGWWYNYQTWTVCSSKGCSHFTDITRPWGVGQGQNVGLRDFCHNWTLLPPGASMFHKHMSSFLLCCIWMLYVSLSDYFVLILKYFTVSVRLHSVRHVLNYETLSSKHVWKFFTGKIWRHFSIMSQLR